jgi:hypothetical protein
MKRRLGSVGCVVGVVLATAMPSFAEGITDFNVEYADDANTVGLWHFNGDAANAAALGPIELLTLQGPTLVTGGGKFGGALSPGGDGGGAYIFDEDYLLLDETLLNGSFTIEMWILPTAGDLDPGPRPTSSLLAHYKSFDTPDILDSGRGVEMRVQNSTIDDATQPGLFYARFGEPPRVSSVAAPRGLSLLDGLDAPTSTGEKPLTPNVWNHVAVTRELNTWRLWINGAKAAEIESEHYPRPSPQPFIVGTVEDFIRPMYGMIDEVRVSKVARDPSAAGYLDNAFADDANTVGLWHFDGDGSNAAAAASATATMSLKPRSSFAVSGGKFGGALSVGGGGQGEGGAFIENADIPELNAALAPQLTTRTIGAALFPASPGVVVPKDFTIEAWVKPTSVDVVRDQGHVTTGILEHYNSDISANRGFDFRIDNLNSGEASKPTNTKGLPFFRSGDPPIVDTHPSLGLLSGRPSGNPEIALTADTWNHVAVTRQGSVWKLFVNGQMTATITSSYVIPDSTAPFIVGAIQGFIRPLGGMIDEVRISDVARDPSVAGYLDAAFADDANTVGLWHFDGDGSNAAAAASPTAVMLLQGSSTFEASGGKFGGALNVGSAGGGTGSGGAYIDDANIPELDATIAGSPTPGEESGATFAADTWTHIGVTHQGNTWKMWVNGAVVSQAECPFKPPDTARPLLIGAGEGGAGTLAGMIDEVRISKVARDLSVVPTSPYADDADTVALWHFDGDGSSAAAASQAATVQLQGGAAFASSGGRFGGALNANGAGGSVPDANLSAVDAALSGGDFTIECFVRATAADLTGTASPGILNKYLPPDAANEGVQLRIDNSTLGTGGRQVSLKGVPYFRTGEASSLSIVTGCGTAQVPDRADFTLEAWVMPFPEDLDPNTRATTGILEHYRGAGLDDRAFDMRIDNLDAGVADRPTGTRGLVYFRSGDGINIVTSTGPNGVGLLAAGSATQVARTPVLFQPGVWSHVAVTREWVDPGPDLWRLWVNDKLVSEVVADFAIPDSFEPLVIGAGEDLTPVNEPPGTNWNRPFNGLIDEVRISNIARVFGRTTAAAPGDFDLDGDVDLVDFLTFQACFNGPNRPPAGSSCEATDFDQDADTDLVDFLTFQACFNGPNRPAACE